MQYSLEFTGLWDYILSDKENYKLIPIIFKDTIIVWLLDMVTKPSFLI